MKNIVFKIKYQKIIGLILIDSTGIIDKTYLTVGQSFDILLIRTIDKILRKNTIERLSLKSVRGEGPVRSRVYVEISGKMTSNALSGMILNAVVKALMI